MKKLLSILLILTMVFSLSAAAFAEEGKEEPDLKTFLSELAEKDEVTEEDLSELFTIVGNLIAREVGTGLSDSDAGHKITSDEFSLYYGLIDLGEKLKLYFCDGAEDLPYMDVSDWLPLINLMVGDSKMGISFTMETDGPVVTLTRHNNREEAMDNGVPLTIDFEKDFMEFATQKGMVGVKGHRSVGGFRASCYNAQTIEGCQALVACMKEFEAMH